MTIKEVEERIGIARANVRFYEKEGLLFPKRNPLNDYREYSVEDVETLRKIIFLRNLGVSVEEIRNLQQGKTDIRTVVTKQMTTLKAQQKETENACRICEKLMTQKDCSFEKLELPETENATNVAKVSSLGDVLSELWMFWDKLVIYGFFAVQFLYTIIVYPFLPEQIPISWNGLQVTEYAGRWYFFFYLFMYGILMYLCRMILYTRMVGGLRCYIEELNAVVTVGVLGIGFATQMYTVLFLQGLQISADLFLIICGVLYVVLIALIILFYRKHKSREREA